MSRYLGGEKNFKRLVISFYFDKARRFETREEALYKLTELSFKYGKEVILNWKPIRFKNLAKNYTIKLKKVL